MIAVATPGHTADHLSVIVMKEGITYVLAGDISYNEALMLDGQLDGVSADGGDDAGDAGRAEANGRGAAHDLSADARPESAARLSNRQVTDVTRQTVTKPDWRE